MRHQLKTKYKKVDEKIKLFFRFNTYDPIPYMHSSWP